MRTVTGNCACWMPDGCLTTAWWLSNDYLTTAWLWSAWQRPNISMYAWQPQPEDQFITTAKFIRNLRVLTFFRAIYHARKAWCTQTFHHRLIQATPFMNAQQVLLAQTGKTRAIVAFSTLISTKILLGDFDGNTILTTLGNLQNREVEVKKLNSTFPIFDRNIDRILTSNLAWSIRATMSMGV